MSHSNVQILVARIRCHIFGTRIVLLVRRDRMRPVNGRTYIQPVYHERCVTSGEQREFRGRKWYLSLHMTDDEVVKTCYAAFRACVEHEVMEGFTFDDSRVFNPHAPFRALIKAGRADIFRAPLP